MIYESRLDMKPAQDTNLNLTTAARVIRFILMILAKDTMQFSNLDRVCLNLLAYKWIHIGPPGTLAVDQITDCYGDIPKAHIYKTLAALNERGLIDLGTNGKNVSLTRKGFDHIRSEVSEPVCTNVRFDWLCA